MTGKEGKDPITDALLELALRDAHTVRKLLAARTGCAQLCGALKTQLASADAVCKAEVCGYGACRQAMDKLADNDHAVAAAGCSCRVVKTPWVEPPCAAITPSRSAVERPG